MGTEKRTDLVDIATFHSLLPPGPLADALLVSDDALISLRYGMDDGAGDLLFTKEAA